jgi:spore germination protein GerM
VACGIQVESEPVPLTVEFADPPEIVEPTPQNLASAALYLTRGDQLVMVTRDLEDPPDVSSVLESLLGGLTDPEARAGLGTSIPAGTKILSLDLLGDTLHIDVGREFTAVGGEQEILAVAQIVLTATSFEEIDLVSFELEGVPTAVPVSSGALSVEPVRASDYRDLVSS